jgi:thioredoxin-like negative regulator of GroEL
MQKKKWLILLIVTPLLILSCNNSNRPTTEDFVSKESDTDDYASLQEANNVSPKITEDLSGRVIILTERDFMERITALDNPKGFQYLGKTPCIVEFYTDWCKPCTYQSETLRILAPEYQGRVIFYKLNVEKAYQVRNAFNVENVPMVLFFKPRGEITTSVGFLNMEKLKQMIADLLLNS